ncbi:receptor-type tyrosine-protein phosphatase H-like isoform X2 [Rhincodon typus]|uniref:receptor-type tyrosine-protein phosphatase H-like isoform X2 n=1 Tax=Rhincodon typus TaxID=259920 RepID=UPI00202F7353|nr:receptor-type tyrosine-protein phosphatase H-like isoform X2 [Rhincodon typus]
MCHNTDTTISLEKSSFPIIRKWKIKEVVYSLNCSAVSILPENTTALKVTWTNLTQDFKSIELNLDNVTKTDNKISGEVIFDDLMEGMNYNISIKTQYKNSTCKEVQVGTTNPSPVTNLSVVNRTTETLTINWTEPDDKRASEYTYNITVTNETESFIESYSTVPGQNMFQVSDLEPGLRYNLTVKAVTPENTLSDPETVGGITNPSPVTNLSLVNRTTQSLAINWTAPTDIRASNYTYNITVTSDIEPFSNSSSIATKKNVFQVTVLNPGIRYNLTVKACTPENIQSDPETVRATTDPTAVSHLSVVNRTTDRLTINWTEPTDKRASEYTYNITVTNETESFIEPYSTVPGQNMFQVPDLEPGLRYNLTVKAVTPENIQSDPAIVQSTTTPGAISSLQCSEISGYSILVVWSKPRGNYTGFNISSYDGGHLVTAQTIGKKYNFLVENLQPGRKYTFHIYTQTGQSHSARITQQCWTKSTPIIIGAVIGSLLGLILIGLLLFFIITKRVPWGKETNRDLSLMSATPKEFKPVHLSEYESYFQRKHADADFGFAEEYQSLSTVGIHQPLEAALLQDNKVKNRYTNVLPYDASRVKLTAQPGNNTSDYINASYMPGYRSDKEFIAAQGPLSSTLEDFWQMIWEQKTGVIVMLTNCMEGGRVKCERYWPLDYTPCTYGNIAVTVSSETILSDWTIRDFSIKQTGSSEIRSVSHFHFTAWPDHGVPKTTEELIAFHKVLRDHLNRKNQGFPIVHCSAGVGRTGTLIALDYLLQQMEQEDLVDVYGIVRKMRQNRPLMVQTELQYIFLHQCMLDTIQMKREPEEAIYENQRDLIYENVSAIHATESHVI